MARALTARRVVGLMGFEAATLVLASTLHLAGVVNGGAPPHGVNRAGIAEAIIAAVLIGGILGLLRGGRRLAIGAVFFAIAGFGVGLSMTAREGAAGDIAYHVAMLPILLVTLVGAWRTPAAPGVGHGSAGKLAGR